MKIIQKPNFAVIEYWSAISGGEYGEFKEVTFYSLLPTAEKHVKELTQPGKNAAKGIDPSLLKVEIREYSVIETWENK
jgi:hypothetical protein